MYVYCVWTAQIANIWPEVLKANCHATLPVDVGGGGKVCVLLESPGVDCAEDAEALARQGHVASVSVARRRQQGLRSFVQISQSNSVVAKSI